MSYTTVQDDVRTLSHRADLDAQIPIFIRFVENELNRRLRHRNQEMDIAETALVNGEYTLPADFSSLKWLENTTTNCALKVTTSQFIHNKPVDSSNATYYAIDNNTLKFWPTAGSIQGVYYAKLPALETNDTNWLDDSHHDLYVYMTLKHLFAHINDTNKAGIYKAVSDELLMQIQSESDAAKISGSPLTQRPFK